MFLSLSNYEVDFLKYVLFFYENKNENENEKWKIIMR